MAGYSGTPLPQKLGLKPDSRLGVFGAPTGLLQALGTLPAGVRVTDGARAKAAALDVILCFARSCAELQAFLPRAHERLDPSGGLWVCWPKKTSGVATDLTESEVRNRGLAGGLVDNKVCAIDEVWSGLRLVVRVKDRPKPSSTRAKPKVPKKTKSRAKR